MSIREKLEGFPNVYYVTLKECVERQQYMSKQFEEYGINGTPYFSKKMTQMDPPPVILDLMIDIGPVGLGVAISHLNMLKHWYENTDEEMAIFCEDDHDFSNAQYWSFNWKEFMENLPPNWECVQLIKIISPIGNNFWNSLKLELTYGRWWGSLALIKRSWVKKVLDRHIVGENVYRMKVADGIAMAENVLYWDIGTVYNLPLFNEETSLPATVDIANYDYLFSKVPHRICQVIVQDFWKAVGPTLKVQDLLRI